MLAGVASFFQLGQDEDPPFTFRAMVIRAFWPGATALQVSEQVTDKLEEILQEAPHVDKIRSYSKAGETTIFIEVKDSAPAKDIQIFGTPFVKKLVINVILYLKVYKGLFITMNLVMFLA
jgi:multidrug efflux pump